MINRQYDEQFRLWLENNRQQILEKWMELIRIPSVRGEKTPHAPFGPECARALEYAASLFQHQGFSVRTEKDAGYALAQMGEGEKTICLYTHSDVVPVGDGWTLTDPFDPKLLEGALVGRGATDNKNGVMAALCIFSALQQLQIPLKNRLQTFIGSNEESGMQDVLNFVGQEKMPELNLVPDGYFPCSIGEKSKTTLWVSSERPLSAIKKMDGGKAFNVVLDRLETELIAGEALEQELAQRIAGNPGYTLERISADRVRLVSIGVSKHAAAPTGSVNALYLAARVLAACQNLPREDASQMALVAQALEDPFGEGMGIAYSDPEFGRLTAANGMVKLEDGILWLSLDSRYGIGLSGEKLKEGLCAFWEKAGWKLSEWNTTAGFSADPASPVPGTVKAIFEEMTGRSSVLHRMSGVTYCRHLKNAFSMGTVARPAEKSPSGPKLPPNHGGAHQRDEMIELEAFFLGVRILFQVVLALDGML